PDQLPARGGGSAAQIRALPRRSDEQDPRARHHARLRENSHHGRAEHQSRTAQEIAAGERFRKRFGARTAPPGRKDRSGATHAPAVGNLDAAAATALASATRNRARSSASPGNVTKKIVVPSSLHS